MIEVDDLTKRYGKRGRGRPVVVSREPGTITGFLGPNGAGKSTTLRSVLGLVHPDAGSATVLGQRTATSTAPLHRVGAVLEASEVHPGRSGRNHLRVLATAAGVPRSRVEEVLALVELTAAAKRRVKGYSLGMRQRLGLASALLGDPEVLVLDEPANGLDPGGDPLASRSPALARRGGPDGPGLEPRARGGRPDRRPRRDHPSRQARPAGADRRGARGRAGGTRVRSPDARQLRELLAAQGATATTLDGKRSPSSLSLSGSASSRRRTASSCTS